MDFKYIGLVDETIKNDTYIPPTMEFPIIYKSTNILSESHVKQKYCRIHTIEGCIITVNLLTCCQNGSKFSSILFGIDEDFLIDKSDEFIDVWIGQNKNIINNILSISRDGINMYYPYFVENLAYSSKKLVPDHHNVSTNISIDKDKYSGDYDYDIHELSCPKHNYFTDCESCWQNYYEQRNKFESLNNIFIDNDDGEKSKQYNLNSDIVDCINKIGPDLLQLQSMAKSKYSLEYHEKMMFCLKYFDIYNDDVKTQLSKRYN